MFSTEQRKIAIETFIRFDHSYADTIAELGVPDEAFAQSLVQGLSGAWGGQAPEAAAGAQVHLGDEAGCRGLLPRTRKEPCQDHAQDGLSRQQGVPLRLDRRACPGQRKCRGPNPKAGPVPLAEKIQAVAELESRSGTAAEVAEKHGVSRTAPYVWRREIMGDNVGDTEEKGVPASREYDDLPDDIEVLQDMLREAKMQLRKVQLEPGVRQATLGTARKARAPTQSC